MGLGNEEIKPDLEVISNRSEAEAVRDALLRNKFGSEWVRLNRESRNEVLSEERRAQARDRLQVVGVSLGVVNERIARMSMENGVYEAKLLGLEGRINQTASEVQGRNRDITRAQAEETAGGEFRHHLMPKLKHWFRN